MGARKKPVTGLGVIVSIAASVSLPAQQGRAPATPREQITSSSTATAKQDPRVESQEGEGEDEVGELEDLGFDGLEDEFLYAREGEVESVSHRKESIRDVPATINVMTGSEMDRSGLRNVAEMLRRFPGTNVGVAQGPAVDFTARGQYATGSTGVLTLVDGVSHYDDVYGINRLDTMPYVSTELDRLEWVRGTGAAIYGANAHKGALALFTRSPRRVGTRVVGGFGERDTAYGEVITAHEVGKGKFLKVVAGAEQYDAFSDSFGNSRQRRVLARQIGKVTFLQDLTEDSHYELEAAFINIDSNVVRVGNSKDFSVQEEHSFFRSRFQSGPVDTTLAAKLSEVDGVAVSPFHTEFAFVDLDSRYTIYDVEEDYLYAGVNLRYVEVQDQGTINGTEDGFLASGYLNCDHNLSDRLRGVVGFRLEAGPNDGQVVFLPRVGATFSLDSQAQHLLRLGYGRSHRNASLFEQHGNLLVPLFGAIPVGSYQGQDIPPEIRNEVEFAYKGSLSERLDIAVTAFHDWYKNPVQIPPDLATTPPSFAITTGEPGRIYGVESELRFMLNEQVTGRATYTYNEAHGSIEAQGIIPEHMATLGFAAEMSGGLRMAVDGAWSDKLIDRGTLGTIFVENDYLTVSGRIAWRPAFMPGEFGLNARNVFNHRHVEAVTGATVGSTVTVDYRVDF